MDGGGRRLWTREGVGGALGSLNDLAEDEDGRERQRREQRGRCRRGAKHVLWPRSGRAQEVFD